MSDVEVAFDRSSLVRVGGVGLLLLVAAVAMLVIEEWRAGAEPTPLWLRGLLAGLAALVAGWLLAAVSRRLRSDDPAIRIDASGALFHVNPGRRVLLRHDEITGVGELEEVRRRPHRAVIGDRLFQVTTTREEGFWASTIVVGSRFVDEDLGTVRDLVCAALARDGGEPRGSTR